MQKDIEKGKLEVAKNLLKIGLTVKQVAIGIEISMEEIEKLKKK